MADGKIRINDPSDTYNYNPTEIDLKYVANFNFDFVKYDASKDHKIKSVMFGTDGSVKGRYGLTDMMQSVYY